MENKISSQKMLVFLNVLSWILFIGLCIHTGSMIFSTVFTAFFDTKYTSYYNLSSLFEFNPAHFYGIMLIMIISSVLKAYMFYLILKILKDRKLNFAQPFTREIGILILQLSYLAIAVGLLSFQGNQYSEWLKEQGVNMLDVQFLQFSSADVWLFMGVTLLVIGQIFKRGIELQVENDLTV